MKKLNNWLAEKITGIVGSMWCAYGFAVIALIGFPYGSKNPVQLIQWFAQTFLQLVLLSVIVVGQNIQSDKHDELTKSVKKIHKHLGIKE